MIKPKNYVKSSQVAPVIFQEEKVEAPVISTAASEKVARLVALGGKEWVKGAHHRVYLDDRVIAKLMGLVVERYGTGAVKSATLNGEDLSNTKAHKMLMRWSFAKYFYCAKTGAFRGEGVDQEVIEALERI